MEGLVFWQELTGVLHILSYHSLSPAIIFTDLSSNFMLITQANGSLFSLAGLPEYEIQEEALKLQRHCRNS